MPHCKKVNQHATPAGTMYRPHCALGAQVCQVKQGVDDKPTITGHQTLVMYDDLKNFCKHSQVDI